MARNFNLDAVSHKDLTTQQIADIQRRVQMDAESKIDFESYFVKKRWPKGIVSKSYRTLVHTPLSADEIAGYTLKEFIAPSAIGLDYANYSITTKSYGTKFKYSWMDVQYNADNVVADGASELRNWSKEMRTLILGNALLSTKSSISWPASGTDRLIQLFKKMNIAFTKLKTHKINGEWDAMMPIEVVDKLTDEYHAAFANDLPAKAVDQETDGYIGSFKSFRIKTPVDLGQDVLIRRYKAGDSDIGANSVGDIAGYWIVFIGKTQLDKLPFEMFSAGSEGHELLFHGLGSGLVEDENGKPVADDNDQVGSIGLNMINFSARVVDDRAVVTCFVPASYISGFSEDTDMANMKKTVSEVIAGKAKASNSAEDLDYNVYEAPVTGNPSPLAYVDIEVVKAADGAAIASPTVAIKVGSSTGDAVSAGADGLYVLTPGQTYYYSVSKTSYTTQTGTFVYKEGGRFTRTFALATA